MVEAIGRQSYFIDHSAQADLQPIVIDQTAVLEAIPTLDPVDPHTDAEQAVETAAENIQQIIAQEPVIGKRDAIARVLAEVFKLTHTLNKIQPLYLQSFLSSIESYLEKTKEQSDLMNWQGWVTLTMTGLGAVTQVASSLIPKGTAPSDPRDLVHGRVNDLISTIADFIGDPSAMRGLLKGASQFFQGASGPVQTFLQSPIMQKEAERNLLNQTGIQKASEGQSFVNQTNTRIMENLTSLQQQRRRGDG
jgi:hypothetical protein